VLEGEMEATFRGKKVIVRAGGTLNIPANAPHQFHNTLNGPARFLCICAPAGLGTLLQRGWGAGRHAHHTATEARPHRADEVH
jgi:mannose-6-phosphate isomerase-like protein (cupin superfamily)